MALPASLRNLPYTRLGPRSFRTDAALNYYLPYYVAPTECENCGGLAEIRCSSQGNGCKLTIQEGFAWNGASGPTWDSEGIRRSALVHDALYWLIRERKLPLEWRTQCDRVFRHLLRQAGVNPVRRWYYYAAVRLFGKSAAEPR